MQNLFFIFCHPMQPTLNHYFFYLRQAVIGQDQSREYSDCAVIGCLDDVANILKTAIGSSIQVFHAIWNLVVPMEINDPAFVRGEMVCPVLKMGC